MPDVTADELYYYLQQFPGEADRIAGRLRIPVEQFLEMSEGQRAIPPGEEFRDRLMSTLSDLA
jgi:hypothetical protein